jgi:CheY-like chemotaxis protein
MYDIIIFLITSLLEIWPDFCLVMDNEHFTPFTGVYFFNRMHREDYQKQVAQTLPDKGDHLTVVIRSAVIPSEEEKPCLMVVEDNRLNSELVRMFLKEICTMDFARTGEEAVEMARVKKYDAIIMDINLGPGMDGIQATKIIRTFDGFQNIPIMAVTGYAMESDKEMILQAGCSHFIAKPIEKNQFTELVKCLIVPS